MLIPERTEWVLEWLPGEESWRPLYAWTFPTEEEARKELVSVRRICARPVRLLRRIVREEVVESC